MPVQLVPKSTTFDDLERPLLKLAQNMRLSDLAMKI